MFPGSRRLPGAPVVARGRLLVAPVVALVVVLLAGAGACGFGDSPSEPGAAATSTSPAVSAAPTPALDPVQAAEQGALEAYRGMWDAFSAASRVADPEHPDLAMYATGDALEVLVAGLEANRREGLVSDGGQVALYPEVVEVEPADVPTEVRIADCADTSDTRRVRPSGPPFTDSPGGWRQVTATIRLVDKVWKVTDFAVQEVRSCAPEE